MGVNEKGGKGPNTLNPMELHDPSIHKHEVNALYKEMERMEDIPYDTIGRSTAAQEYFKVLDDMTQEESRYRTKNVGYKTFIDEHKQSFLYGQLDDKYKRAYRRAESQYRANQRKITSLQEERKILSTKTFRREAEKESLEPWKRATVNSRSEVNVGQSTVDAETYRYTSPTLEMHRLEQQYSDYVDNQRMIAEDPDIESNINQYVSNLDQMREIGQRRSDVLSREAVKRKRGHSLESRMVDAQQLIAREQDRKIARDVQTGVIGGKYGSFAQEETKLSEAGKKLEEAFKNVTDASIKLKDALSGTIEEQNDANEALTKATEAQDTAKKEYEKQSLVVRSVPTDMARRATAGMAMQYAAQGADAGLNVYKYAAITSENELTRARIGVTGVSNQQFDDYIAASRGDMSALTRLANIPTALNEAQEFRGKAEDTKAGGVGTGLLYTAAAGFSGNISGALSGGAGTINNAVGFAKGIPQTMESLNRYSLTQEQATALAYQRNQRQMTLMNQMQQVYGNITGATNAGSIMDRFSDTNAVRRKASLGFDLADTSALVGQAMGHISSFQDFGGVRQQKMIERGMTMERGGVMSASQYLGLAGTLDRAGSSRDLEEMIAKGFERGTSNSKVLVEMGNAISDMSSNLTGATGGNVISTLSDIITSSMGNLKQNYGTRMSDAQRLSVSAGGINNIIQGGRRTGTLDFAQTTSMAGLMEDLGGRYTSSQILAASEMDIVQLKQAETLLKRGDSKGFMANVAGTGLGTMAIKGNKINSRFTIKDIKALERARTETYVRERASAMDIGWQNKIIDKLVDNPSSLTEEESSILGSKREIIVAAHSGGTMGQRKLYEPNASSEIQKAGIDLKATSAETTTKLMNLGDGTTMAKSFSEIVSTLKKQVESIDINKIMTNALKGAKDLKLDSSEFNIATDKFARAVDKFSSKVEVQTSKPTQSGQRDAIKALQDMKSR